jgi:hypothetical protein
MPWDQTRTGTAAKYRSKEHRDYRASLVRQLERDGYLICTADVCVFDTRIITNANGRARDGLHAGHEDNGIDYRGPQHMACNVRDGAKRASARSHGRNATDIASTFVTSRDW